MRDINFAYSNDGSRTVRIWDDQLQQFKTLSFEARLSHSLMLQIIIDHKKVQFDNRFSQRKPKRSEFFTKHNPNRGISSHIQRKKKEKIAPYSSAANRYRQECYNNNINNNNNKNKKTNKNKNKNKNKNNNDFKNSRKDHHANNITRSYIFLGDVTVLFGDVGDVKIFI